MMGLIYILTMLVNLAAIGLQLSSTEPSYVLVMLSVGCAVWMLVMYTVELMNAS
jgi:hypothetical protein